MGLWVGTSVKSTVWEEGEVLFKRNKNISTLIRDRWIKTLFILLVGNALLSFGFQTFVPKSQAKLPNMLEITEHEEPEIETVIMEAMPMLEGESEEINLDDIQVHPEENVVVTTVDYSSEEFEVVSSKPKNTKSQQVVTKKSSQFYHEAKKLFLYGKFEEAKSLLEKQKTHNQEEKELLSEIYLLSCKTWVSQNDIQKGLVDCEKSYNLTRHPKAKQFMKEADGKAENLYYQAYAMENLDPEEAKNKYHEAIAYASSQSAWKRKSLERIKKMK